MAILYTSFPTRSQADAQLTGRQRRRLYEWETLKKTFEVRNDVDISVTECGPDGIPLKYLVKYHIKSISGVTGDGLPLFSEEFVMSVTIPDKYPQAGAPVTYRFDGENKPWHPNIVYHGDLAGNVCVNQLNTNSDIAWCIERVALYLRYELYHAEQTPPFPVDLTVAKWVREKGEPQRLIFFNQD